MKKRKISLSIKINLLVLGIIICFSIILSLVAQHLVTNQMKDIYTNRVKVVSQLGYNWLNNKYPGEWSIVNGELYKGNTLINNNNDFVDDVGSIAGGAVTIFQGDTRVATNIRTNGQRAIGTKAAEKVINTVIKGGTPYIGEANIQGRPYLTMYKPLKDANGQIVGMWFVGTTIDTINANVLTLIKSFSLVMVILSLLAIGITLVVSRSMVRPLKEINRQLVDIADGEGDLTKEVNVKSNDEIGDVAHSFNRMLGNLRTMIRQISMTAEQVAAASEELSVSAEETSRATEVINLSMQEVAFGSEKQVASAIESTQIVTEISKEMDHVSSAIQIMADESKVANEKASRGNQITESMVSQMNVVQERSRSTSKVIDSLNVKSMEISQIVTLITDISSQTNLLALNAAIESARAGEHGRGFAVVADEVRKLAEQSNQSANQIRTLITQIQEETKQAVLSMEDGTNAIVEGLSLVQDTKEAFGEIVNTIQKILNQSQEVSPIVEEVGSSTHNMVTLIEGIAKVSEQNSGNTQSVAASSEEQNATMEEITASVNSLSVTAEELHSLINRFKV